jgi:F-type H+-transporting ATPase subunit b
VRRALQIALLAATLVPAGLAAGQQPSTEPQPSPEHAAEAATGHAGEHEAHGIDPKTLGLQLLNFAVLVFILMKFGGGAINKALAARHQQLRTDIDEAARIKSAAEQRFKQQEQRLANLEREIEVMITSIRQEAEQEKARIIAGAEEKARRVQEETTFALEQQVKEAEARFRGEVAQAAVKVADELLRRSVTPSDEQRLVQSFVGELGGKSPPRGKVQGKDEEEVVG